MAKDRSRGAPPRRGAKNQGAGVKAQPVATTIAAPEKAAPKKRTNPIQFLREVRAEARKISWPSRKETWITSVMVFIMVAVTTAFFAVVDVMMGLGVSQIIKIGQ
jgi:preprotein translocase subunit SecE